MKGMKGVWFTMESAIACMIMGMFILVVAGGYVSDSEYADASQIAYDILKGLDDRDALRSYAAALDYSGLDSEVDVPGYDHAINICDPSGSCVGPEPNATNVWVGSYFIAGPSVYQPLEIKLFLWEVS